MPNENIFGDGNPTPNTPVEGQTPVTPATPAPAADPTAALLANIKGDDGAQKYKDVTTALSALQHSQEYIKQLKQQLEEASQKASQAVTMEQVMAAINKPAEPTAPTAPSGGTNVLTAEDVLKLLQVEEQKKVQRANTAKVAQKFKEVHGDKAEETFYAKASEIGLTRDAINSLAATSPDAVFSMFGLKGSATPAPATPSGINTYGMQEQQTTPRSPVMGFKRESELLDYWKSLKTEVEKSLNVK